MSASATDFPPGPCGVCGEPDSVSGREAWDYSPQVDRNLNHTATAVCCACGARAQTEAEVLSCFGGQPGYAVGLAGPHLAEALVVAGWTRQEPLDIHDRCACGSPA